MMLIVRWVGLVGSPAPLPRRLCKSSGGGTALRAHKRTKQTLSERNKPNVFAALQHVSRIFLNYIRRLLRLPARTVLVNVRVTPDLGHLVSSSS